MKSRHDPEVVFNNQLGKFEVGTVVRILKTNEFAIITDVYCLMGRKENFLHYSGIIEGRGGPYALYDADIELECLPCAETLAFVDSNKKR